MKQVIYVFLSLLIMGAPAFAQEALPAKRTISVSGEAKQEVEPDRAILSLALASRAKALEEAKRENDGQVKKLVAIAQEYKIPKEKLSTSGVYISPEYRYDREGKRSFTGYLVSRNIQLIIDNLEIHERLLSAIVDAKIDQVNGVEFSLAKPEALESSVRLGAFEDAKVKAQAMAQAAGGRLGKALSISLGGGVNYPPQPMPRMMAMKAMEGMAGDASVAPSLPGLITVQQNVSVVFELE